MARWFLLLLTGCSLTLSGPDPNRPRNKPPTCDTSKSLVALDGVLAAGMGIAGIAGMSSSNASAGVVPALLAVAFIGSAVHGNNAVNDCHREMENYDSAMAARDIAPAPRPMVAPSLPAAQPAVAPAPAPQEPAEEQQEPEPTPPAPPQPRPQPAPGGDRWQAFWREVP